MASRQVYFWRDVWSLLRGLAKRTGLPFNTLVNRAVLGFSGACVDEEFKVWAEIAKLCREDSELRRVSSVMLRSGSYLPKYADRLFRPPWDAGRDKTGPYDFPRSGEVPLKALSPAEEKIMRRVLARREAIAARIAELLDYVLPREKFRLKSSKSLRSGKHKSVKNVRTMRGDV